jgi:hypothetical protein
MDLPRCGKMIGEGSTLGEGWWRGKVARRQALRLWGQVGRHNLRRGISELRCGRFNAAEGRENGCIEGEFDVMLPPLSLLILSIWTRGKLMHRVNFNSMLNSLALDTYWALQKMKNTSNLISFAKNARLMSNKPKFRKI